MKKFCLCRSLSLILFVAVPVFAQSEARYEASDRIFLPLHRSARLGFVIHREGW